MAYIDLNLTTILMAAVCGLLVSFAHFLLSRPGERPGLDFVVLSGIAEFWVAAILAGAFILGPKQGDPWVMTLATTIIIWIGFIVPVLLVTLRFRGLPGPMAAADSLHWLGVLMVQAVVMQVMGLEAPPF